jgi:Ras-related protein Rab-11B
LIIDDYKKVKVQIWDTAGQEKHKAVTLNHYRHTVGPIIVFDLNNIESYENVS